MFWRKRSYRVAALLAVVVAGALAAIAVIVAESGASPPPGISVLSTPTVPLPAFVEQNEGAKAKLAQPTQAHLALTQGDKEYFVVPGADNTLCLIVANMTDDVASATCQAQSVAEKQSIFIINTNPDRTLDVAGIVPDGVTTAAAGGANGLVHQNVYVLQRAHPFEFLQLGGRGTTRTVDLDTTNIRFP